VKINGLLDYYSNEIDKETLRLGYRSSDK